MTARMPHRIGLRSVLLCAPVTLFGCDSSKALSGPEAEVTKPNMKISLPAVPSFDLPAPSGDFHAVKEMRVKGKKLLETEITVKGFVTWTYDCPTAIREPNMTDAEVMKLIEKDQTKCERAKFYIGDVADTPAEKSMWVVDVPRPFWPWELQKIKKKEERLADPTKCEPGEKDPKKNYCPPYKVGDEVEVTGTWRLSSLHGEHNSEGLLVFKKMKNKTQNYETPPPPEITTKPGTTPPAGGPARPSPEDIVKKSGKKSG
jgi:hypothetical protein